MTIFGYKTVFTVRDYVAFGSLTFHRTAMLSTSFYSLGN